MTKTPDGMYPGFERVKILRLRLEDLVQRQLRIVERLDMPALEDHWRPPLEELEARVRSDSFKVLVLGQFNRGKSTFINALIGKQVLPTYATPTTAVINEIKYGDEPRILLFPRARKKGSPPKPIEIGVDQLEEHVVVREDDTNKPNPYTRADVYWPLDLCRSGVELIDSPGLNEDRVREQHTLDYLAHADAVIMLLDALQPVTETERDFFTTFVRPLGHEDVFWVFNRINQVDEDDRDGVKSWARKRLEEFGGSDQRIFFVNAKGALKARISGSGEALLRSDLPEVERSLEKFLARQRGRTKVLIPARQLQRAVRAVDDAVAAELDLLDRNVEELREAYRRNQGPLERLESRVGLLSSNLAYRLDDLVRMVEIASRRFLDRLGDRLGELTDDVAVSEPDKFVNPLRLASTGREIWSGVVHDVSTSVQNEVTRWASTELTHHITSEMQKIEQDLRDDVRDFEQELNQVRLDLSLVGGHDASSEHRLPATTDAEAPAPVGASGVQFMGMQLVTGVVGGGFGAGATAIVLSVLGIGGALVLPLIGAAAAVLAAAAAAEVGTRGELAGFLKTRVARQLRKGWQAQADETCERLVTQTRDQVEQLKAQFRTDLTSQVAVIQEQVDSALREMTEGQQTVDARKRVLSGLADELDALETELGDLIDEVLALDRTAAEREIHGIQR